MRTLLYSNDKSKIECSLGDITDYAVDAIVNAANTSLLGGGGVDGAIHRRAGELLLLECMLLEGAEVGESKITGGYDLPAKHVIHTVGPYYEDPNAPSLLASCYRTSLDLMEKNGLHTVAFSAISTGKFGYPFLDASRIAYSTALLWIEEHPDYPIEIDFVCYSEVNYETFSIINKLI